MRKVLKKKKDKSGKGTMRIGRKNVKRARNDRMERGKKGTVNRLNQVGTGG